VKGIHHGESSWESWTIELCSVPFTSWVNHRKMIQGLSIAAGPVRYTACAGPPGLGG
jgi:hypothetical protein